MSSSYQERLVERVQVAREELRHGIFLKRTGTTELPPAWMPALANGRDSIPINEYIEAWKAMVMAARKDLKDFKDFSSKN